MDTELLKVGELARRTGLSVRTLHHYDAIGLLRPRRRTPSGHRLYGVADVARLLRVRALQQLGFSLEEVRACLDDRRFAPLRVLDLRLEDLHAELTRGERLRARLLALRSKLASAQEVSLGEFLQAIEEMTMFEKYYTQDQLAQLAARGQKLGEDRMREVAAEWPRLIAAVRAEQAKGTDPKDPAMQALAKRWQALIEEFTGGDAGIRQSLTAFYRGEPQAASQHGLDDELMRYVGQAMRGTGTP